MKKFFILSMITALTASGCFEGLIKKYTRSKDETYPKIREALASNPTITVVSTHGMRIEAPHLDNTAKAMQKTDHASLEAMAAKYSKDLATLLGKAYPLTKMKFDASLGELRTGNVGAIISGADPEYDIPPTVTSEYIIVLHSGGLYTFTPSQRRNIHGEVLGSLYCDVSASLTLINAKTKKEVGRYKLGEGRQKWEDVTENSFKAMADNGSLESYLATNAHQDTFAAAKAGVQRFVTEIKNAKAAVAAR